MGVLRTPDERFADLPDYPYPPNYVQVQTSGARPAPNALRGRRAHGRAGGPADARSTHVVLPVPQGDRVLVDAGLRVVAPDNIGYGRSDKLTEATDYTFARHVDWLSRPRRRAGPARRHARRAGLGWAARPERVGPRPGPLRPRRRHQHHPAHLRPALEGELTWAHHGVGEGRMMLQETLLDYVSFYQRAPDIVPSFFLDAVAGPLPADVLAAYDAPFPDRSFTAGLRQLIALIPLTRNDPGAAIGRATMAVLEQWQKPFLTAYSDGDPATRGWDGVFQRRVPGARGQDHVTITGAGHFVQEQRGEELGRIVADFVAHTLRQRTSREPWQPRRRKSSAGGEVSGGSVVTVLERDDPPRTRPRRTACRGVGAGLASSSRSPSSPRWSSAAASSTRCAFRDGQHRGEARRMGSQPRLQRRGDLAREGAVPAQSAARRWAAAPAASPRRPARCRRSPTRRRCPPRRWRRSAARTPLPGEGSWHTVVTVRGRPAVQVAALRPDGQHTSFVVGVLRMDPALVRGELRPGTTDPGGTWRRRPSLTSGEQRRRRRRRSTAGSG